MSQTRKAAFLLKPADFTVPPNLFYPCFCAACQPRTRRKEALLQPLEDFLAPRIGAPIKDAPNRNSSDGLLELYTPLLCRRHSGGRDTVTVRSAPARDIRRRRVLAFLYRCMTTPGQADNYIASADAQTWLPVPAWNFAGHALDAPLITSIRKALADAGLPVPLNDIAPDVSMPWMLPAAHVADVLASYVPDANAGIALAQLWADLCSADDAPSSPNETIRAIATRVAFEPYPLDVYPWVPRWGPAVWWRRDIVNALPDLSVPAELRRWWNFNGPTLRRDAFARHQAGFDHTLGGLLNRYVPANDEARHLTLTSAPFDAILALQDSY